MIPTRKISRVKRPTKQDRGKLLFNKNAPVIKTRDAFLKFF